MDYPAAPTMPTVIHAADYAASTLATGLRAGTIRRAGPAAYLPRRPGDARDDWELQREAALARCAVAIRRLGGTSVLSHESAALLHGLWVPQTDAVHVTHTFHAHRARAQTPHLVRHHRPLGPADTTTIGDLPVTTLERTVLDCIAALPPGRALAVADSAARRLVRPDRFGGPDERRRVRDATRRLRLGWAREVESRGPRRGRRQARSIVGAVDPWSESPGESRTRWSVLALGLPRPRLQVEVATPRGTFYPDLAWSFADGSGDLFGEFDGDIKYRGATGEALVAEKRREDALRSTGATVVRVVSADLEENFGLGAGDRVLQSWPLHLRPRLSPDPGLAPWARRPPRPERR